MADRIKTVSTYNGTSWGSEVPIGADASNVDVTLSNNTKSNLQTVLGSTPSGSSITERINSKISTSGGDVADTVVSKNINNYDSSTTAGDDILTDTAATMSTNTSTLWSRFNLFRKKVSNNFANYFEKSNLVSSDVGVTSTGDNNTAYTTAAINNYLSNVIGYTSASDIDPDVGSVATQLSTLNNNVFKFSIVSSTGIQYKFELNDYVFLIGYNSVNFSASQLVAWGNTYYSPSTPVLNLPITYKSVPYVWNSGRIEGLDGWLSTPTASPDKIGGIYLIRPNKPSSGNGRIEHHVLVFGQI